MFKSYLLLLCLLLVVTGCAPSNGDSSGSSIVPILQLVRPPDEIARAYLDAWKTGDYQGMYARLSPRSQQDYPFPVFQQTVEEAMQSIAPSDIQYTIKSTQTQGASAAVTYDVTFISPVFERIADPDRIMRLIQIPGGWGIAWSSMDIVNGLTGGSRVAVTVRRAPRANIYDRNGRTLAEQGGTLITLYHSKVSIPNLDFCLDVLAEVLMRQRRDLAAYFDSFAADTIFYMGEITPEVNNSQGLRIDEACGTPIRRERQTRVYVGAGSAAHITGYIGYIPQDQLQSYRERGYADGELVGLSGVEQSYEAQLAGQAEQVLRIISPANVILRELGGKEGTSPVPVTLTIDRDLQIAAGQAMADAFNYAAGNWAAPQHSTGAGVVVLDVKTGAVLAMVSWPFYDPGIFNAAETTAPAADFIADLQADPRQPLINRVVQQQYFPGSTFKIITTAAASGEGLLTPTETFDCQLQWDGRETYGDTFSPRSDWRVFEPEDSAASQPAGLLTMAQALTSSCNPFFYEMGARLFRRSPETLASYSRRMGLASLTGIDVIPREAAGVIPTPTSVEAGINEAIGQGGVQVTILQMARMVAAVANGGTLYRPYLVQRVGGIGGQPTTFEATPQVVGQMNFSAETLQVIKDGMCNVTRDERLGTAWFVFNPPDVNGQYNAPYAACGKTGTAQSGRPEPYGWFVAYAPADDPQIAVVAMVEFGREGSETAAPIVRRIMDAYFNVPQEQVAPFPLWWFENEYVALPIPENQTGG